MGDPKGFLKIGRKPTPKRTVEERLQDYRYVYEPWPEEELKGQASRCMDCGVPFCNTGCPLGNLIPDWNDLVYSDHWRQAIDRLRHQQLPRVHGDALSRAVRGGVRAVHKRQAGDHKGDRALDHQPRLRGGLGRPQAPPPEIRTGKKVAVVGSGPAGLAAAQQLNWAGHSVVVFEKDDRIGGLLMYGIPDYKIESGSWTGASL